MCVNVIVFEKTSKEMKSEKLQNISLAKRETFKKDIVYDSFTGGRWFFGASAFSQSARNNTGSIKEGGGHQ